MLLGLLPFLKVFLQSGLTLGPSSCFGIISSSNIFVFKGNYVVGKLLNLLKHFFQTFRNVWFRDSWRTVVSSSRTHGPDPYDKWQRRHLNAAWQPAHQSSGTCFVFWRSCLSWSWSCQTKFHSAACLSSVSIGSYGSITSLTSFPISFLIT